jgi:site-specific recombinase XerD
LRELRADEGKGFVFAWPDGRPWTSGYLTHALGKAVEAAGVKDLHVHDLRHRFACRLLRGGVDIYAVSKLLRHASVVMSERYAHLSQGDLKAAVGRNRALQTDADNQHEVSLPGCTRQEPLPVFVPDCSIST